MRYLGKHLLIDLWECGNGLDDVESVKNALMEAAAASGATLIEVRTHQFSPQGVTGVAILAESHLAIHTWPEYQYVAADLFTCGNSAAPEKAIEILRKHFRAEKTSTRVIDRGMGNSHSCPTHELNTPTHKP